MKLITGDWKVDAKCSTLLKISEKGFNNGKDFDLGVKLCREIVLLIKDSEVISEADKVAMISDIESVETRIVVDWAVFVERVMEEVNPSK